MAANLNEVLITYNEKVDVEDETNVSTNTSLISDSDQCLPVKHEENSYDNLLLPQKIGFLELDKDLFHQEEIQVDKSSWDEIEISADLTNLNENLSMDENTTNETEVEVDDVTPPTPENTKLDEISTNFEALGDEYVTETLEIPEKEIQIDRKVISTQEKNFHHEYFEGKYPKTPDRYLKIRNYILDSWDKTKPKYLNKTTARNGLKNCGDVNCISKIHRYLEAIGAINFGCDQVNYEQIIQPPRKKTDKKSPKSFEDKTYSKRVRKKRIIEGDEIGGYTLKHLPNGDVIVSEPQSPQIKKQKKNINPFKLITLEKFTQENKSPFEVQLHLGALLVMDLHSHLSHAEVIGLVGGTFDDDKKLLHVTLAEPCLSLSTAVQCEMDPVSQSEASAFIEKIGLTVVGWYHSHPTFPPNPSITDLETQTKYQEWFGQKGFPFVAFILSPYSSTSRGSQVRCFMVGSEISIESYRKPFQLDINYDGTAFDSNLCMKQMRKVTGGFEQFSSPVNLHQVLNETPLVTYFHKMLSSIKFHMNKIGVISTIVNEIQQFLENIFIKET